MSTGYSTSALSPMAVIDFIDVSQEWGQYINSVCVTQTGAWLISVTVNTPKGGVVYTRRSQDRGQTWDPRVYAVPPGLLEPGRTIEMGQLLPVDVDGLSRIYQFHVQHTRENTRFGQLRYSVSHDDGRSWEGPGGRGTLYELPAPSYKLSPDSDGWHLMAPGLTLESGEWLLPMNISTDPLPLGEIHSELVFGITRNIFTVRDPADLKMEFYPPPPHGVFVPYERESVRSLGQEPQVAQLSDGRLFCVCRTGNGCLYYTVSSDSGRTWEPARPLLYRDGGEQMIHPNAPCPFRRLPNGTYALLFCNNDGTAFGGADPFDHTRNRQPVYVSIGRETGRTGGQPLEFGEPRLLCSIEGFQPEAHWRDLTYGFLLEDGGEYFHFYNAVWRFIQVNRVDPALLEMEDGR